MPQLDTNRKVVSVTEARQQYDLSATYLSHLLRKRTIEGVRQEDIASLEKLLLPLRQVWLNTTSAKGGDHLWHAIQEIDAALVLLRKQS